MRVRGVVFAASALALTLMGLTGCENWQGTSADPDMSRDTLTYKNNDDPQNTGAGAGAVNKPPEAQPNNMGGEPASEAAVKGTDNRTGTELASTPQ